MNSVLIKDITQCTGCGACANICTRQAIQMQADENGFLYPAISQKLCINCGLCRRVCPINESELCDKKIGQPLQVLAGYSLFEEERAQSSSGGVFSILAKKIIEEGGIVCGVELDETFKAKHSCASSLEEVKKFRGSKYVQSEIGDIFKQIKVYLENQKAVLFTGTPCQVAGLRNFLRKDYEQLVCVDCVCFGVPSPLVFQQYLEALKLKKGKLIRSINFRSKVNGWTGKKFSFEVEYSDGIHESEIITKNPYHRTFFGGLNARKCCHSCRFKSPVKPGDLTLADFWGVEKILPKMDDGKGTSLIFVNTDKGIDLLEDVKKQMIYQKIDFRSAIEYNQAAILSLPENPKKEKFFEEIRKDFTGEKTLRIMKKYTEKSFFIRVLQFVKRKMYTFLSRISK